MPTPCWLKHLCSIRAWVPVSFFLSILSVFLFLSIYFWLIPWSAEARWAHFLAWASKTLSRRRTAPSPTREGARCLRAAAQALRTLLVLHLNQGTSASFSLLFSYRRLWTTRFRSIKGPTLNWPVYISIQPYHPLFLLGQWTTGRKILKKKKKNLFWDKRKLPRHSACFLCAFPLSHVLCVFIHQVPPMLPTTRCSR